MALRRVFVSSDRLLRQAATDAEADVEYSEKADTGTAAVVKQQLIAKTELVAADSNILQGGAETISKNSIWRQNHGLNLNVWSDFCIPIVRILYLSALK